MKIFICKGNISSFQYSRCNKSETTEIIVMMSRMIIEFYPDPFGVPDPDQIKSLQ